MSIYGVASYTTMSCSPQQQPSGQELAPYDTLMVPSDSQNNIVLLLDFCDVRQEEQTHGEVSE